MAFLANVYRGALPESDPESAVPRAARQAVLASLVAATVSGTVFDLGVAFYAFAAAASLQPSRAEERYPALAHAGYGGAGSAGYQA